MRIRLRVSNVGEEPFEFDQSGPVCNLGRDGACELPFPDKSASVSWRHARIDLGPDGAWLCDLQSSNGTFVNERRVTDRVLLKVGDEIRLGKSGPEVKVVKIDVGSYSGRPVSQTPPPPTEPLAPRSARAPAATPVPESSGVSLFLTAILLVLVASAAGLGFLVWKQTKQIRDLEKEVADLTKRTEELEKEDEIEKNLDLPPAPSAKRVVLGKVGPAPGGMLGVLLSSQGAGWKRLRPDDPVSGAEVLTELPGYRSEVRLTSGVHVLLWGDLSLHETLPILESRMVLHEPTAGIDLDLTVERGRFVLSNHKEKGEAVIRVRFRDSTWEARLPDQKSALAIELRGGYLLGAPARIDGKGDLPITLMNFATRGKTRIDVLKAPEPGRNADMLTFRLLLREEADKLWPQLSQWWGNGKFDQAKETREVYQQLLDFLDKVPADPVEQLRKAQVANALSPTGRVVSVFSLGAVEDLTGVLSALENKEDQPLREAGLVVLRQWLGRDGDNDRKARDYLVAKHGFSDERARQAVVWLHGLSESDYKRATSTRLFAGLMDSSLTMRQLASWRLGEWLPPPEGKTTYDPAGTPEQRDLAIKAWKESVPDEFKPAAGK